MQRALDEAMTREHIYADSGHLILVMLADSASSGYELLVDWGADPDQLAQALLARLPTKALDEDAMRRDSERYTRLTGRQVRELTHQHAAGREASRLLRLSSSEASGHLESREEPDRPFRAERTQLEGIREESRGAWLRLAQHHTYLAWAAAKYGASKGHNLAYCYAMANRALSGACLTYSPSEPEAFEEYVRSYIASSMSVLVQDDVEDA